MPEVEVNGTRLFYQQSGDGPDVVLVHAVTSNQAVWVFTGLVDALAADFRVTTYDLRGHGASDRPPTGYTSADMAEDFRQLHAALGLGPALPRRAQLRRRGRACTRRCSHPECVARRDPVGLVLPRPAARRAELRPDERLDRPARDVRARSAWTSARRSTSPASSATTAALPPEQTEDTGRHRTARSAAGGCGNSRSWPRRPAATRCWPRPG